MESMITTHASKHLTWVDLENPTGNDIAELVKKFAIHPAWAHELTRPTERARTETHDHAFYAALHYPDHPSRMQESRDIEIDFIVGTDFIITSRFQPIDTILDFSKQFSVAEKLDHGEFKTGSDVFLAINNRLYQGLREELELLRKEIKIIEAEIFQGNEFKMVHEISHLHRRILDFKQSLRSHKVILNSFELQSDKLFGKHKPDPDAIYRDYFRVENALENNRELIRELRETNDSLLTAKNNEVTKKLTLMAFVTFPLTLVATVLISHNSPAIFQGTHGFWLIIGILIVLFILMQIYFIYKKWI
jgi:magnesium transporter